MSSKLYSLHPVSYTHLDVYKRQHYVCVQLNLKLGLKVPVRSLTQFSSPPVPEMEQQYVTKN